MQALSSRVSTDPTLPDSRARRVIPATTDYHRVQRPAASLACLLPATLPQIPVPR